jgi:hypothetical protein
MRAAGAMLFATSETADSRWMLWELGYFDGVCSGRIAILAVCRDRRLIYTVKNISVYIPSLKNPLPTVAKSMSTSLLACIVAVTLR